MRAHTHTCVHTHTQAAQQARGPGSKETALLPLPSGHMRVTRLWSSWVQTIHSNSSGEGKCGSGCPGLSRISLLTMNPRSAHGGFQSPPPRPLHSGHFLWLQEKSRHPQDTVPGTTVNPRAIPLSGVSADSQWKNPATQGQTAWVRLAPGAPSPGILGLFCLTQCSGPRPPDPPHSSFGTPITALLKLLRTSTSLTGL